ncbi:MBL fold metallo-hydrolase [Pseudoduganella danionis]|uniref:MBL fold metallo-hydrolase n=1 Tax=Pseudoduganella danionis TaxID=1890295 RepID=UPI0035AE52D2
MGQPILRLLAFLALLWAGLAAAAPVADGLRLEPIQVSPHVYYFKGEAGVASAANKGFMSNAGFVVTEQGVVVYDALATPALGVAMIEAIRRVTSQPIRTVVVGHYHADHIYGLQAFRAIGAEIIAHQAGQLYLSSDLAQQRLAQRRAELYPWVDEQTQVVAADRWLDFTGRRSIPFTLGQTRFQIIDSSGAHSPEDVLLLVENEGVLFAGDIYFSGRVPFVGSADSRVWLQTLGILQEIKPRLVIPGHGTASSDTRRDIELTKTYLEYLRLHMGQAVQEMRSFEEAYQQTDWSPFAQLPAFQAANRLNAYGTYLLMEKESLGQ